jgi:hypothetical protein
MTYSNDTNLPFDQFLNTLAQSGNLGFERHNRLESVKQRAGATLDFWFTRPYEARCVFILTLRPSVLGLTEFSPYTCDSADCLNAFAAK